MEIRTLSSCPLPNNSPDGAAETLVQLLLAARLSVTAAESCTGGLLAAAITSISGASKVFLGSVVSYSEEVKIGLVGVNPATIAENGVVSTACAAEMAEGVRGRIPSDLAVGITGWAGPSDGDDGQPAGTVCIAISSRDLPTESISYRFSGSRNEVRAAAVLKAIDRLTVRAEQLIAKNI